MVMLLPDHLRLSGNDTGPKVIFLNLNMHALILCLHRAAVAKAEKYGLDPSVIRQSQARSTAAAEEIVRIMRLGSLANLQKVRVTPMFFPFIQGRL